MRGGLRKSESMQTELRSYCVERMCYETTSVTGMTRIYLGTGDNDFGHHRGKDAVSCSQPRTLGNQSYEEMSIYS